MRKEIKTVVYDDELRLEAYRFEGVVQPFPNHFHEYYVIGFVERRRTLFIVQKPRIHNRQRQCHSVQSGR